MQLQIRHTNPLRKEPPLFKVVLNGKEDDRSVPLTPPGEVKFGTNDANLLGDLQWYLEKYPELPIGFEVRAEAVQAALRQWGRDCFDALFGEGRARDWYRDARQKRLDLCFQIVSDDPAVLSWPWEALESRDDGRLALQCRIERQLDNIGDVRTLPDKLPREQLNILYIIARPKGDVDVGFQTLARPLIDFVTEGGWPVHIDVLRPPTFSQLQAVLGEKPDFYHIIHFDGHGGFAKPPDPHGASGSRAAREQSAAPTGTLVFENEDHGGDPVSADKLGELLRPHNIPVMVLNACKSAMMDSDAFASVAVSLLKAGARGVVAMSYSLWVSGAKVFVPAFYRRLFADGGIAGAMQAARREMFEKNKRDTLYGQVEFNDWVVPVLYQQSAEGVLPVIKPGIGQNPDLPVEALRLDKYGFIGRDRSIRQLERAIREKPAGILIHGMAGEGKTTLVRGFLQWLEVTNGLGAGALWYTFEGRTGIEDMINEMLEVVGRGDLLPQPLEAKIPLAARLLRQHPFFIVWDNFESARGIPGSEISTQLDAKDQALLKQLLDGLDGGNTKILITSRSREDWIEDACYPLPLFGLRGEELWQYCNEVIRRRGLSLDRNCETYEKLMDRLGGNPLAVRAILLRLREKTAEALLAELEDDFQGIEGDEATKRIQAALSVFERGLDRAFAPVLRLLGLHEHFADADYIGYMLEQTDETAPLIECFAALESAGLCRPVGGNFYQIHPALRSCLTRRHPAEEAGKRAFVDVMGSLADAYAQKELFEQRGVFSLFGAGFHRALKLASELDMWEHELALLWGLARYAQNIRYFSEAEKLYVRRAEVAKKYGNANAEAVSYGQLGRIAQEYRNFQMAEERFAQVLNIFLILGDEHNTAVSCHLLGMVAEERRDFDAAENWYKKSLAIKLKLGNEYGAAITYHQLGMVAEERRDFDAAEDWYKQSLAIKLKLGNKHGAAITYHQLGLVAQKRRDFDAAEDWYKKSLVIKEKLEMYGANGMETTYHQLGNVTYLRRDFDAAEDWYKKSLAIELKQNNEHCAAGTYHQLGKVAEERGDPGMAESFYIKALEVFTRRNDPYRADIVKESLSRLMNNKRKGGDPQ